MLVMVLPATRVRIDDRAESQHGLFAGQQRAVFVEVVGGNQAARER